MRQPELECETLARSRFAKGLSPSQLEAICAAGRRASIGTGRHLCQQGDEATSFHLLLEGRAKLTQVTADGHRVLVRFLGPGDCCGIVAAHEGAEYQASVRAVEDCVVLGWDRATLTDLLRHYPQLALNALAVLAEQCQAWQRRYREVTSARVEQRVAATLLRLARQVGRKVDAGVLVDIPLSREDLAEMTGTTLFTVSRVLSRWEQLGYVELGRQRVVIRDAHGLVELAEDSGAEPPPPP